MSEKMQKFGGPDSWHSWKTSCLEYVSSLRSEKDFSCELQDILSRFLFNSLEGVVDRIMVPQRCPALIPRTCDYVRLHGKGNSGC